MPGERIASGQEVELSDGATGGVAPAGDNERRVDVAIGGAITSLEALSWARYYSKATRTATKWCLPRGPRNKV